MVTLMAPPIHHAQSDTVESFGSYLHAFASWNLSPPAAVLARCLPPEQLEFEWSDPLVRLLLAERLEAFGASQEVYLLAATGANGHVVRWCDACVRTHRGRHLLRWESGQAHCREHCRELRSRCRGCGWQTTDVLVWLEGPTCPRCHEPFVCRKTKPGAPACSA